MGVVTRKKKGQQRDEIRIVLGRKKEVKRPLRLSGTVTGCQRGRTSKKKKGRRGKSRIASSQCRSRGKKGVQGADQKVIPLADEGNFEARMLQGWKENGR